MSKVVLKTRKEEIQPQMNVNEEHRYGRTTALPSLFHRSSIALPSLFHRSSICVHPVHLWLNSTLQVLLTGVFQIFRQPLSCDESIISQEIITNHGRVSQESMIFSDLEELIGGESDESTGDSNNLQINSWRKALLISDPTKRNAASAMESFTAKIFRRPGWFRQQSEIRC
jgi:hypothetical protein